MSACTYFWLRNVKERYKFRLRRRKLLLRAAYKRRELKPLKYDFKQSKGTPVLCFLTVRNELDRLPFFFEHHRKLGITHFFVVDNNSNDGSLNFVLEQEDASVWFTANSYKKARFGMDWLTWLMICYGHDRWCLTLDADEIFVYPHWPTRPLAALVQWLEQSNITSFSAMMLDLYSQSALGSHPPQVYKNVFKSDIWFDGGNYFIEKKPWLKGLWMQGGVRSRMFFSEQPEKSPTLNKIPLVKWNRRYAYLNSTHSMLPPSMNEHYAQDGGEFPSGVLLHTKFLTRIIEKSAEELVRQEHFNNSKLYDEYYLNILANPILWHGSSVKYINWRQLERIGLMSRGGWA